MKIAHSLRKKKSQNTRFFHRHKYKKNNENHRRMFVAMEEIFLGFYGVRKSANFLLVKIGQHYSNYFLKII